MKTTILVCPGCGANLTFEKGMEKAVCSYCGAQSVLVSEESETRPAARAVPGHSPEFFESALAAAEPAALARRCAQYVDNVKEYAKGGQTHDEVMMRAVEETIDIPEEGKDAFRREILNYIGALAIEGRSLQYDTSTKFHRALAASLYLEESATES